MGKSIAARTSYVARTVKQTIPKKPHPTIKCSECRKTYRDDATGLRNLQRHVRTSHNSEVRAKFTCEKCRWTSPNELCLERHKRMCAFLTTAKEREARASCDISSTSDESCAGDSPAAAAEESSVERIVVGGYE